MTVLAIS